MSLYFSIIIPVYNRPDELNELLASLCAQDYMHPFEIVIIEDGSTIKATEIIDLYKDKLVISYFFKPNSGPGDSRNYGMQRAKGNYFLIFDSDCLIPPHYLTTVHESLQANYVDCFGGKDAEHKSFTNLQKAISYSMTSFFTTGGIRGSKKAVNKFQPRSFNMGISKKVFELTKGFGNIHPGEDPDLTLRIWNAGYETAFIPYAFVYHKRRISWKKFYQQVYKFGLTRPILNSWHPGSAKLTYWFPAVFIILLGIALVFTVLGFPYLLMAYGLYYTLIFIESLIKNNSITIAILSILAVTIQFLGYGKGFITATAKLALSNKNPEQLFPKVFFLNNGTKK